MSPHDGGLGNKKKTFLYETFRNVCDSSCWSRGVERKAQRLSTAEMWRIPKQARRRAGRELHADAPGAVWVSKTAVLTLPSILCIFPPLFFHKTGWVARCIEFLTPH
jgi:hypothetical protein